MPRALDSNMQAALSAGVIQPAILADLTFSTGTQYVWTGVGDLLYNTFTYKGVGTLASLGTITEGTAIRADGTSVGLSGIDPTLYADCLSEIQLGAPAVIRLALLTQGTIIGAPYVLFKGLVDKPTISAGPDAISISLALESRMTNLQRASQQRYTSADQHIKYPGDTGFGWVEMLNDIALLWGS
ncbi:hypothetical protein [Granulicella paludicola]|uniref:hypothetical protein n=1 Tax=Granulicella paludicola TaxID=474951 RepID=UPI0021DFA1CE|nr:hypothetical protein [Granulicella paludicola]